jgi:hypothetical protein
MLTVFPDTSDQLQLSTAGTGRLVLENNPSHSAVALGSVSAEWDPAGGLCRLGSGGGEAEGFKLTGVVLILLVLVGATSRRVLASR